MTHAEGLAAIRRMASFFGGRGDNKQSDLFSDSCHDTSNLPNKQLGIPRVREDHQPFAKSPAAADARRRTVAGKHHIIDPSCFHRIKLATERVRRPDAMLETQLLFQAMQQRGYHARCHFKTTASTAHIESGVLRSKC